jgi:kinesin family protein 3/17
VFCRKEKSDLMQKISMIQKKILVGGENLFEKAQHQAFLIESTGAEIENLDKNHQQLEETLNKKGQERIDVEEKYSSLQEEDSGVSKKIKKVQSYLNEVKEEYADKEHEYQREMEVLLDNNRLLVRETQLACLMIDSYIPKEYLVVFE